MFVRVTTTGRNVKVRVWGCTEEIYLSGASEYISEGSAVHDHRSASVVNISASCESEDAE